MFEVILLIIFCVAVFLIFLPTEKKVISKRKKRQQELYRRISKMTVSIYETCTDKDSEPRVRLRTKLEKDIKKRYS